MTTQVEALLAERAGYERTGNKGRIAQVDAELKRLGFAVDKRSPETTTADAPENAAKPKARRRKSAS